MCNLKLKSRTDSNIGSYPKYLYWSALQGAALVIGRYTTHAEPGRKFVINVSIYSVLLGVSENESRILDQGLFLAWLLNHILVENGQILQFS